MPDGVVKWFDPKTGDAMIARGAKLYPTKAAEMERHARVPGARVHFDIVRERGAERAVNVVLRAGTRVSPRQGRFGDQAGAHHPDEKGHVALTRHHPQQSFALEDRPLEVARTWVRLITSGDVATAAHLYHPAVEIHRGDTIQEGRRTLPDLLAELRHVRGFDVEATDDGAEVTWRDPRDGTPRRSRFRVEHGLIVEQWFDELAP